MNANPFIKPEKGTFISRYVAECEKQRVPTTHDFQREAESCFGWLERHNWRDKNKRRIVSWERIIEVSVDRLKKRKPGYTAPKKVLEIPDCCWRPIERCDCATLIFESPGTYIFPQDMLKAMDAITNDEKGTFDALMSMRTIHEIQVAQYADKDFIQSTCRDLARNYLEEMDQHEYFCRMGWWIEFIAFQPDTHFEMEVEMLDAYREWMADNQRTLLTKQYESRFDMAREQLALYRAGQLTPTKLLGLPEEHE